MFTREWKYLFLILVIFIAACIETDIYLPCFTDMMAYFSISEEKIQGLLTWNFVGICAACPLYGPLSDALGRKKPLLVALGLFLAGSIFTLLAQEFNLMLLGRVLQGLGSGGCFTLGTAVIFDVFQEKKAIEARNRINSICPFIMAGAPMLGGYLNNIYGFRSNFLAIAVFVLISFAISLFFFEETLPESSRKPLQLKKILEDFKKVALSVPFWQTIVIVSLPFAGYLAFLSGISILFVMELGVSKQTLPYFQASLLGAWLLASLTNKYFLDRLGIPKIKVAGSALILIGGVGLASAGWSAPQNPYLLTVPMLFFTFGINWVQGVYLSEGMDLFPDIRGVSASFLTSTRLLIGAAVVGLESKLYNFTIYPIIGGICAIIACMMVLIIRYERSRTGSYVPSEEGKVLEVI